MQVGSAATDILSNLEDLCPFLVQKFVKQEAQRSDHVSKSGLEFASSSGVSVFSMRGRLEPWLQFLSLFFIEELFAL